MHYECRYCDTGFRPVSFDGDLVCESCGAEWEAAKILIEDEEGE
ncbi:hypothetical protein [Psychrobacillus psychrodurans]|nr:hypothetical protein [Psychrobacillus psychrodurans]